MKTVITILFKNTKTKAIIIRGAILTSIALSILFSATLRAQHQLDLSATAGKEFYVSCLSGWGGQKGLTPELQLKVVVEKACYITAKYNNSSNSYWNNWNNSFVKPGIYTFAMPYANMTNAATGVSSRTMTLTSSEDISVYVINYYTTSIDGSTILPASSWGTEYRLATVDDSYFPEYAVVAKENSTVVTLPNKNIVNLNKNQVYHFHSNSTANLTGQKVSSNKPVAVYSGNELGVGIGQNKSLCSSRLGTVSMSHSYEQLWSTDKWGKEFFVWNVPTSSKNNWGGIMAIVANEDNTKITVSGAINGGAPLSYTLNAGGKEYVCYSMTGLCKVESTKPVMLFTILPDVAITYIPPVNRRMLQATLSPFVFPGSSDIKAHSVEMLIPTAYWAQTVITENGTVVPNSSYTVQASPDFNDWSIVRKNLTGKVEIKVSCPGGLLAYMYGHGNPAAYAYLASAYRLQNYFTIRENKTAVDAHYKNTNEVTHIFNLDDNITVKRTVEDYFDYVKWQINGVDYQAAVENGSISNSFTFPASALVIGKNSLTMLVRFRNATADSLYTTKIWLRAPLRSYGDAPASYGTAAHNLSDKLYLGSRWDSTKVQTKPIPSEKANAAENDDALTLTTTTDEYTDLKQPDFILDASGQLTSTLNLTNNTAQAANLQGWIDFNRNGVFDVSELSANVTVAANSGNSQQTLVWSNVQGKIRHGITYMRLRLSTFPITQPAADTLKDGEVEDYMLNFKTLDISKTAESNNPGTTVRAIFNDTITYTITVSNPTNAPLSNISVFDPVPPHTEYVANSASPAGTLMDMNIQGQNLKTITWSPIATLAAGDKSIFSFKAKVTDMPYLYDPNDSIIFNIAYVTINGDTIPSTAKTCVLAGILTDSLQAVDDGVVSITMGSSAVVDILDNDHLGYSNHSTILVEIASQPKSGGSATIEQDKTLRYVSPPAFSGNDSLVYKITSNGTVALAKVRITVTASLPAAIDDHAYVFACSSVAIDVLANDINAASGTVSRVKDGKLGSADVLPQTTIFMYDNAVTGCQNHGGKIDTIRYRVCDANGNCAEANMLIHILRIPKILIADSCSRRPYLQSDLQYKNATYQWHKSTDGGTSWAPVANATDRKLYVTEDALYKIAVTYKGKTVETAPARFVIRKKTKMSNGVFWYDTLIG